MHAHQEPGQVRAQDSEGHGQEPARGGPALAGQRVQAHRQHQGRVREHAQQGEVSHGRHGVVSIRHVDV